MMTTNKDDTKSKRTNTGAVAVAPLDTLGLADARAGMRRIDKWLKNASNGYITIDRISMVAGSLPVVGNLLALVDVVIDVIDIYQKPAPDIFDWVDIGVDVMGVIPVPPTMAAARMGLRPVLFLTRQSLKQGAKAGAKGVSDTIIVLIEEHLTATLAGSLEKFVTTAEKELPNMLDKVGVHTKTFTVNLSKELQQLAQGNLFNSQASFSNAKRAAQNIKAEDIWHNPKKTLSNAWVAVSSAYVGVSKEVLNKATKTTLSVAGQQGVAKVNKIAAALPPFGVKAASNIKQLGNKNTAYSVGWLLTNLAQGIMRFKKKKVKRPATVDPKKTTQATKDIGKGKLEKTKTQAPAKTDGNDCKNCAIGGGAKTKTKRSISFATGAEYVEHVDWSLATLEPLVGTRQYVSRLASYDGGVFGARWVTPFSTSIVELEGDWHYVGVDGRPIQLPDVNQGESYYHPIEGFDVARISGDMLRISWGSNSHELYERAGDCFRLAATTWKSGVTLGLRYDHAYAARPNGMLSDIVLKQGDKTLAHVAIKPTTDGRVGAMWLVEEGQLGRCLGRYEYNAQGDLLKAINENGYAHDYTYNHHLLSRYTDLTGRGHNLEWDGVEATAKAYHEWADDGTYDTRLQWDEHIRLTYETDAHGHETLHYYDIEGYTYRTVYPDGQEEWFFRDNAKNIVKHVTVEGEVHRYVYDGRSNIISHTQPDGYSVHFAYDEHDNLTDIVDAELNRWQREYDHKGNVVAEIDPLGNKTEYQYNGASQPTEIKDALGASKTLSYNAVGQLASYTDCSGKTTRWVYDAQGRLSQVSNAAGESTAYHYTLAHHAQPTAGIDAASQSANAIGHLERIEHPDGAMEYFEHDAEGRLLKHTDPLGNKTEYRYSAAGLIVQRKDALGQELHYGWDKLGRLTALQNENGAKYSFDYDPVGRLLREQGFDGKETLYHYDPANGRLQYSAEPVGCDVGQGVASARVYHYQFDALGRLAERRAGFMVDGEVQQPDAPERYAYDGNGRLLLAENKDSRLQWFYDDAGNMVREHQALKATGHTGVWQHVYNALNQRVKTTRPDGHVVELMTYGSGHVHGVLLDGAEVVGFERDDLHREVVRHLGNQLTASQAYDPAGRLKEQVLKVAEHASKTQNRTQNTLIKRAYRYDRAGQLAGIEDSRRGQLSYKYDPVGRLLEAHSALGHEVFAFDPASNILDPLQADSRIHAQPTSSRYEGAEPMHSTLTGKPRLVDNYVREYLQDRYEYDAYGQLTRRHNGLGETRFSWDAFGRMASSETREGKTEYHYDALGRRIAKRHNKQGSTFFGWDGDTLAWESHGGQTRHYVYEPDSFVPMLQATYKENVRLHKTPEYAGDYDVESDPLWHSEVPVAAFDTTYYYHCDHLGTPQELSADDGEIAWSAQYKAWGLASPHSKTVRNNIRFQGQYFDEETGLHYNRYRYYDPNSGRFVSKDPIGLLGGKNLHQYAPNPTGWADPLGLAPKPKNSTELGKNLTGCDSWPGKQAHHVIPEESQNHPLLKAIGFKMNSASNGIMLPNAPNGYMSYHNGYHALYNRAVNAELNHIYGKYSSVQDRKHAVADLQRNLDHALRTDKFNLYKTCNGRPTGLKSGDWERYIKSSRRY